MSQVTLRINGKPYVIGCEDGGEAHLRALAARIDAKVLQIAPDTGSPGEARLILMAALMVADDLIAAEARLAAAETAADEARSELDQLASRIAAILENTADRLDALAPEPLASQGRLL